MVKKQIQDIINEHLPAQVAGEMKKYIESIEGLTDDLKKAEAEVDKQRMVIADYRKKDAQYKCNEENKKRNEDWVIELAARSEELDKREDRIEMAKNEVRLECMNINMDNMQKLVEKVFGHPRVQVSTSREVPYTDQYGNRSTQYVHDDETHTESKT